MTTRPTATCRMNPTREADLVIERIADGNSDRHLRPAQWMTHVKGAGLPHGFQGIFIQGGMSGTFVHADIGEVPILVDHRMHDYFALPTIEACRMRISFDL